MIEDNNDPARIAELESDNRRLRRLLDQQNAPGELRHRLRYTLALLRMIIRRSARTARDREDYLGHLEDRLDALVRVQTAADEYGVVDLHKLVADELLAYGASEGKRLCLVGPPIELPPKAGQTLALAIHELAVNAVEHGALGASRGQIAIAWTVTGEAPDQLLTFDWKERGGKPSTGPRHEGFGWDVLHRTLPYELRARTDIAFEPDGFRCTIRFPYPPTRIAPRGTI